MRGVRDVRGASRQLLEERNICIPRPSGPTAGPKFAQLPKYGHAPVDGHQRHFPCSRKWPQSHRKIPRTNHFHTLTTSPKCMCCWMWDEVSCALVSTSAGGSPPVLPRLWAGGTKKQTRWLRKMATPTQSPEPSSSVGAGGWYIHTPQPILASLALSAPNHRPHPTSSMKPVLTAVSLDSDTNKNYGTSCYMLV